MGHLITWNSWARQSTNLSTNNIKSTQLDFRMLDLLVNHVNIWYEPRILQLCYK